MMRTTKACLPAWRILWLALLGSAQVHATEGAPAPAEAFGRIPHIQSLAISPDGNLLAWGDNSEATQSIVIFDLKARAGKRKLAVPAESKLRDLDWADNRTLLVTMGPTNEVTPHRRHQYEFWRTGAIDVSGGPMRFLLMDDEARKLVTGAQLIALRTGKRETVIMSSWDWTSTRERILTGTLLARSQSERSGWIYKLFEVDTRTGWGTPIEEGTPYTDDWVVNKHGRAVARSEFEPEGRQWRVLHKRRGSWTEIHRQDGVEPLELYGLTPDETAIVAVGAIGEGRSKLWSIPLDGSGIKVLFEDADRDVELAVRDRYSWAPIGARVGGPQPQIHWFDAAAEARYKTLTRTFDGRDVTIVGRSETGSRVLVDVSSHSTPSTYYLVDFDKRTADTIGEDYPALANVQLGEARAMTYKARDAMEIAAYVTLPPGASAKKLPLVVLPHGGPESRDDPVFDWTAQFLATRGYAVLQPQFRGSTGFGEAHRKAGYGQWGGLMQDDITDAVKALVDQGLADPERVCIVGMSYGGYAALAGAAFTPDLYACAASINGVSDLPHMLGFITSKSGDESNALAYWSEHIGSRHEESIAARSPARAAKNIRAPILLIHAVQDSTVPVAQSQTMAKALQSAGKQHRFVELEGEDHWLSRSDTRVRVLQELEAFLSAHLHTAAVAAHAGSQ